MAVQVTIANKSGLLGSTLGITGGITGLVIARRKGVGFWKGTLWVIGMAALGAAAGYGIGKV